MKTAIDALLWLLVSLLIVILWPITKTKNDDDDNDTPKFT
jgi:hypothetical protein